MSRREVDKGACSAAPVVVTIYAQDACSFMARTAAELPQLVEAGRWGRELQPLT